MNTHREALARYRAARDQHLSGHERTAGVGGAVATDNSPAGDSSQRVIAHPVEDDDRKLRASYFGGLPVMPTGIEVCVLARFGFFHVVGQRVGKLNLQLL